jgi:hypothetical protein
MTTSTRSRVRERATALLLTTVLALGAVAIGPGSAASSSPRADTKAPRVRFGSPTTSAYNPVTIRGTASDDVGVRKVRVRIRRGDNDKYFNGTSWQRRPVWLRTKLGRPGAASTTWSATFQLPVQGIVYDVQAIDTSGNRSSIRQKFFEMHAVPGLAVYSIGTGFEPLAQGVDGLLTMYLEQVSLTAYLLPATLSFTVPDSLEVSSTLAGTGWTCTNTARTVSCSGAPDADIGNPLYVSVNVAADAPASVTVTGSVTTTRQLRPFTDSMSVDFPVTPAP